MSFIRKGFFEYRVFNGNQAVHIGRILISKPDYEHVTRHIDNQPDITTVFEFKKEFLEILKDHYCNCNWFLGNNDIHSILLNSNTEADYLHYSILKLIQSRQANALQIDEMVVQLLDKVMHTLGNTHAIETVPDNVKQYHLPTIEAAQAYIIQHFNENISLPVIAM